MRHSQNYNLRLPERLPERTDPADIDDLTYDIESIDGILKSQDTEDKRLERDKVNVSELNAHKTAGTLDHPDDSVTDAKLGDRTILSTKGTLQTLLTAIGNAFKAITGAEWGTTPATTLAAAKGHMDSWENPHGVTAGQTGAYTTAEADAAVTQAIAGKADTSNVLTKDNAEAFDPTGDYQPATKKYIDNRISAVGGGDMSKAVYDTDNDGVVDRAETADSVAWTNVSGRPSSMPANGGDADTVDGYHAASFALSGYGLGTTCISISDWNIALNNGWYMGSNTANAPNADWWYGYTVKHNDDWVTQSVCAFTGDQRWMTRTKVQGAWQGWSPLNRSFTFYATIGTGWTNNGDHFTQWVSVSGLLAGDNPTIDLRVLGLPMSTITPILENWGYVFAATCANGGITIYAHDTIPTVNMPIQLKVVR